MGAEKKERDMDLEWKNRVLCSDESCIGTIGVDGRCRECGLAYKGVPPQDLEITPSDEDAPPTPVSEIVEEAPDNTPCEPHEQDEPVSDNAWERRTLCRDESCIGVVDEQSGCCKECGKPYHDT